MSDRARLVDSTTDPYSQLLGEASAASTPMHRLYTDADFAKLAHEEPVVLGLPEATVWGAVMAAYVFVAGVRLLSATGAQAAGDKKAESRFTAFSARWTPGFLLLLAGYALQWPLFPTLALTLGVAAFVAVARLLWTRRGSVHLSRMMRVVIASSALWVLTLQLWGFVWAWDRYFSVAEFTVLHLAVPMLTVVAIVLARWVRKAG